MKTRTILLDIIEWRLSVTVTNPLSVRSVCYRSFVLRTSSSLVSSSGGMMAVRIVVVNDDAPPWRSCDASS